MSNVAGQLLLQPQSLGEVFISARNIVGPSSYTTGGVTISANTFAMLTLKILLSDSLDSTSTYFVRFKNRVGAGSPTMTVVWYVAATGAEVAATTDLSASSVRVVAIGN